MTNMIERVAMAIIEGLESVSVHVSTMGGDTGHCLADGVLFNMADVAEHVIKAMREPEQYMVQRAVYDADPVGCCLMAPSNAGDVWTIMIDAAITPKIEE